MRRASLALAAAALAAGCGGDDGPPRVAAWGRVTGGGQPLPGTEIVLAPAGATPGPGAEAFSGEGGEFKLADARGHPRGVVPGEYTVGLRRVLRKDGTPFPRRPGPTDPPGVDALPKRLLQPATSPLKVVVPADGGEVNIDVPAGMLKAR